MTPENEQLTDYEEFRQARQRLGATIVAGLRAVPWAKARPAVDVTGKILYWTIKTAYVLTIVLCARMVMGFLASMGRQDEEFDENDVFIDPDTNEPVGAPYPGCYSATTGKYFEY